MTDAEKDEEAGPPGLPPGTPFYMTPAGAEALRAELRRLWEEERPKVVEVVAWAAGLGDRSENADYQYGKRRLREIDRRVRFLRKRLEKVQVVDPAAQTKRDQVFFGATVTYARASDDAEVTIRIVGVDEADAGRGDVSWMAPVARALLGARVGDVRRLRTPGGVEELEVLAIAYPEAGQGD
ncbi:MAG: transcription elongation factor GreB [Acetobacteraceae bacterium]